ncbi:MAG: chalcone isomerase family protein [Acidobacteria bacterium]|nr:chalcone isomerase family protein [Acidobacteriota bacterium]
MKRIAMALVLLTLAIPALARELKGISMPDRITVEGKQVVLNGMGLRTKLTFKVYVAGLYLENATQNANAILSSDQIRRVEMVMMRDLDKGKISEAVNSGFEKNSKSKLPELKARLDQFNAGLTDLKEGDKLVITYIPSKGINLQSGAKSIAIEGKDFADALFAVWLGQYPVDDDLKDGMLGL